MGRLQRDHGGHIVGLRTFSQVLTRHGAFMGSVALVLTLVMGAPALVQSLAVLFDQPGRYVLAIGFVVTGFVVYLRVRGLTGGRYQAWWIVYLFYISAVEEIAFRLYLPVGLNPLLGPEAAIIASNAVFGAIHYVTLRWKLGHCVFAALGGIGLSRLLESSGDLMLVILVHFIATFLNTPRSPEGGARRG